MKIVWKILTFNVSGPRFDGQQLNVRVRSLEFAVDDESSFCTDRDSISDDADPSSSKPSSSRTTSKSTSCITFGLTGRSITTWSVCVPTGRSSGSVYWKGKRCKPGESVWIWWLLDAPNRYCLDSPDAIPLQARQLLIKQLIIQAPVPFRSQAIAIWWIVEFQVGIWNYCVSENCFNFYFIEWIEWRLLWNCFDLFTLISTMPSIAWPTWKMASDFPTNITSTFSTILFLRINLCRPIVQPYWVLSINGSLCQK